MNLYQVTPGRNYFVPDMPSVDTSTILRRRINELELEIGDIAKELGYSRSWGSQELLGDPDRVIRLLLIKKPELADILAARLKWKNGLTMALNLGILDGTGFEKLHEQKRAPPNVSKMDNIVVLPILSLATAGEPTPSSNDDLGYYIMPKAKYHKNIEVYLVDGDSMESGINSIQHGDSLVVDTRETAPRENKIFVIENTNGGGYTVKRVARWNNEWWLTSDNNRYPPFQLTEAKIIGRVIDAEGKRDIQ